MDDNRLPKKILTTNLEGEEIQEDHKQDGKMFQGGKNRPRDLTLIVDDDGNNTYPTSLLVFQHFLRTPREVHVSVLVDAASSSLHFGSKTENNNIALVKFCFLAIIRLLYRRVYRYHIFIKIMLYIKLSQPISVFRNIPLKF